MTQHFSASDAAQVLRLVANGAAALTLLPPHRTMQQLAVGELTTSVELPGGATAQIQWFVNCGEISHCVQASMQEPGKAPASASLQTWYAHNEDDPLAYLQDDERQELEYVLLHLA